MKGPFILDINFIIIVISIISLFNIFMGLAIKKYKIAEIISGYNKERDNPEVVCKLTGDNLEIMGYLGLLLSLIYFFLKAYVSVSIYLLIYVIIVVGICVNIYIRWTTYNRKNR